LFPLLRRVYAQSPAGHMRPDRLCLSYVLDGIKRAQLTNLEVLDTVVSAVEADPEMSPHAAWLTIHANLVASPQEAQSMLTALSQMEEMTHGTSPSATPQPRGTELLETSNLKRIFEVNSGGISDACEMVANIACLSGAAQSERLKYAYAFAVSQNSLKKALLMSRVSDDDVSRQYFFMHNLHEDALSPDDTLAGLEEKFTEMMFSRRGLDGFGDMRNLVVSGRDFCFANSAYAGVLGKYFKPQNLAQLPQIARGEAERFKKKKGREGEETVPPTVGYDDVETFIKDQQSVYDLPFHG